MGKVNAGSGITVGIVALVQDIGSVEGHVPGRELKKPVFYYSTVVALLKEIQLIAPTFPLFEILRLLPVEIKIQSFLFHQRFKCSVFFHFTLFEDRYFIAETGTVNSM